MKKTAKIALAVAATLLCACPILPAEQSTPQTLDTYDEDCVARCMEIYRNCGEDGCCKQGAIDCTHAC
jgi:hypothetical protein